MSSHMVRYDTNSPAIQKQQWHSREAQIESPLFECEWAFRILALVYVSTGLDEFVTVLKFVRLYMFTRNGINYETKSVHTEPDEL
jgi:hypothetical protein